MLYASLLLLRTLHQKSLNTFHGGFPGGANGKEPTASAGDSRDMVSILGQENPLEKEMATHSSMSRNPMNRGAWWAKVREVTKELDMT